MSTTTGGGEFSNPLRKFKLVFLGEQSGKQRHGDVGGKQIHWADRGDVSEEVAKIDVATTSFCQLWSVRKSALQP